MAVSKPEFIERDVNAILQELITRYEEITGKALQPAQVEYLLFNSWAYREGLIRQAIQDASLQNLVLFSSAPVLDLLGQLVGVTRLGAAPAQVDITFTLIPAGGFPNYIPAGTRVSSTDGRVVFETLEEAMCDTGVTSIVVKTQCQTAGTIGNGYLAGTIKNILDPQGFIVSATNVPTTGGGSDEETDDQLRERILLAPGSFSNAGSRGAYKYWARTASANIVDVAIDSPVPGTVKVWPMVAGGVETPAPIIAAVEAVLTDEKVRPLTDTVIVEAPTRTTYTIDLDVTLYPGYDSGTVQAEIIAALEAWAAEKYAKLGLDIVTNQIIAKAISVEGVYDADISNGLTDIIVAIHEFAVPDDIIVNIIETVSEP